MFDVHIGKFKIIIEYNVWYKRYFIGIRFHWGNWCNVNMHSLIHSLNSIQCYIINSFLIVTNSNSKHKGNEPDMALPLIIHLKLSFDKMFFFYFGLSISLFVRSLVCSQFSITKKEKKKNKRPNFHRKFYYIKESIAIHLTPIEFNHKVVLVIIEKRERTK